MNSSKEGCGQIEDALESLRDGRPVLLHADVDGIPGALLVAADSATPKTINFMLAQGRGLIRLALTPEQCRVIGAGDNSSCRGRYSFSVDAREGIATGVSAADRARTIAVAISPNSRPEDLVCPGHVFVAPAYGADARPTDRLLATAVELPALAGMTPAGVLCDVLDKDGEVALPRKLESLSRQHGLPQISIGDLINHRALPGVIVERVAQASMPTRYGLLTAVGYRSLLDGAHHLALVKGNVRGTPDVPVAVHRACLAGDAFQSRACDCRAMLDAALRSLADTPRGIIIHLSPSDGNLAHLTNSPAGAAAKSRHAPGVADAELSRQILRDLGTCSTVGLGG